MLAISLLSLTSISQMALFLGIGLIIFGWVEKKQSLIVSGLVVFILMGAFCAWAAWTIPGTAAPEQSEIVTKSLKLKGYFRMAAAFSLVSLCSLLITFFKVRFQKSSLVVVLLLSIALFFMLSDIMSLPG